MQQSKASQSLIILHYSHSITPSTLPLYPRVILPPSNPPTSSFIIAMHVDRALFSKRNFQESLFAFKPTHKKKSQTIPSNEKQYKAVLDFVSETSLPGMRCHQKREDRLLRLAPLRSRHATENPR
ncbi:hypothetical protein YC2023_090607 [Brassica napus]